MQLALRAVPKGPAGLREPRSGMQLADHLAWLPVAIRACKLADGTVEPASGTVFVSAGGMAATVPLGRMAATVP